MNRLTGYIAALGLLALPMCASAETSGTTATDHTSIIRSLAPIDGQIVANRAIDLDIRFTLGSAKLSPEAHAQLKELGKALLSDQLKHTQIGIYGHTDSRGSTKSNQLLSEKRAKSVVNYLVINFDITEGRLEAKGFGEERPKNATRHQSSGGTAGLRSLTSPPLKSQSL